jgi:ribose 1,5-bisphosphokinase PhnN
VDARPYLFAVVLTGPPGAGKTSVLEALSDALTADDVGHATVEVEALTSAHPALDDEQWVMPVAAICGLYRRLGYDVLPVTATVESAEDLRAVVAAVGADAHAVVRLEAEPETLRKRIIEREPETFTELDQLVAASARLSGVIAGVPGIALAQHRGPAARAGRRRHS